MDAAKTGIWLPLLVSLSACSSHAGDAFADVNAGGSAGSSSVAQGGSSPSGGAAPGSGGTGTASGGSPVGSGGSAVGSGGSSPGGGGGAGTGPEVCSFPEWNAEQVYLVGDKVMFHGNAYIAEHGGDDANVNLSLDPTISTWWWAPYDSVNGSGGRGNAGSGGSGAGGSGSGGSSSGDCPLDDVVGSSTFYAIYSARRDPFYTYEALCTAITSYPGLSGFANSGNGEVDKREAAAFFANVSRETGELDYIDQLSDTSAYHGRGPLQLTHDYNYQAAGDYLGENLIADPNLLSTDPVLTWAASLWFWMIYTNNGSCHGAITSGNFGGTIRIINGGFECNGPNEAANQRIAYYQDYCSTLGVSPGNQLTCW